MNPALLADVALIEQYLRQLRIDIELQSAKVEELARAGEDHATEAEVLSNLRGALAALVSRAEELQGLTSDALATGVAEDDRAQIIGPAEPRARQGYVPAPNTDERER